MCIKLKNVLCKGIIRHFLNGTCIHNNIHTFAHTHKLERNITEKICGRMTGVVPCPLLPWGLDGSRGLISRTTETGSRMERAVSSSLDRLQENSSRPSMEQFSTFSLPGTDKKFKMTVPWNKYGVPTDDIVYDNLITNIHELCHYSNTTKHGLFLGNILIRESHSTTSTRSY